MGGCPYCFQVLPGASGTETTSYPSFLRKVPLNVALDFYLFPNHRGAVTPILNLLSGPRGDSLPKAKVGQSLGEVLTL